MKVSDFEFELPDELIAQEPPPERGGSRLLVLDRATGAIEHRLFSDLPDALRPDDLLVLNNTRVFPARLLGQRVPSGGAVECLLLGPAPITGNQQPITDNREPATGNQPPATSNQQPATDNQPPATSNQQPATDNQQPTTGSEVWSALMHPGQKLKPGALVVFERNGWSIQGEVLGRHFHGRRTVRLSVDHGSLTEAIEHVGHIPLPPYIAREDTASDRDRYQTVFARHRGSIAAPTAGLHFTAEILAAVRVKGIETAEVTLHVGYGTFKPVRVDDVESHQVDPEWYDVSTEAAAALTRARREQRRIIAVGTTTIRVLESLAIRDGQVQPASGETRAFIYPGHRFQLVDGLITNFHLPRSSLLMLVAAFTGRERIIATYGEAVAHRYRFYSYGDAMFVG